jgi:BirA family transcriptional regulator, biotin operon repressor / biotin---[acetyl-CoA-carboxylase] ligase
MSAAGPTIGSPHIHHRHTDSTNIRLRELAEAGAPHGTVVTADEQDAGRGRQGRRWFAPPGTALLYSALLRPLADRPLLPLAVPLAVAEAAESLAPIECELKWPNDVWVDGRKLAGILIEGRPQPPGQDGSWAVVGVGLNVAVPPDAFPEELRETATSIGHGASVEGAKRALDERLSHWIEQPAAAVLGGFRERDALRGRRLSWEGGGGVAAGIDESGHLLVDTGEGKPVALGAGEVHLDLSKA